VFKKKKNIAVKKGVRMKQQKESTEEEQPRRGKKKKFPDQKGKEQAGLVFPGKGKK